MSACAHAQTRVSKTHIVCKFVFKALMRTNETIETTKLLRWRLVVGYVTKLLPVIGIFADTNPQYDANDSKGGMVTDSVDGMDTDSGQPMIGKYSFVDKRLTRVSRKGNDRESDSTDESQGREWILTTVKL